MSTIIFNIAKGAFGYYATLPATNDALIAVPIETTGLESDATLQDYDTLAALLAAANNEQTTMGRKTLASVTSTVDDTGNKRVVDFADITWTAATGNACSKLVICYDPDTTGGTDADLIPLFADDFVVTPAGGDVTYQVNASGIADAS
jgi:hypothetical protein